MSSVYPFPRMPRPHSALSIVDARIAFAGGFPVIEFGNGLRRYLDEVPLSTLQRLVAAYRTARLDRDNPHGRAE